MASGGVTSNAFRGGNRTRAPSARLDPRGSCRVCAATPRLGRWSSEQADSWRRALFMLSGFLITSILVSDQLAGTMSYRRFYINRVLRLYPALVTLLVCVAVVIALTNTLGERVELVGGLVTGLTYTTDIPSWPLPQLGILGHLWTLAIEEQFYLFWPVLLLVFVKRGKAREFCWIALAAAAIAMVLTVAHGAHGPIGVATIYTWPTTWAVTLIAGALYAVGGLPVQASRSTGRAALVGLTVMSIGVGQARYDLAGYLLVLPAAAILGVILIANATSSEPVAFLLHPAVRYIGRISYSIYLWNYPLAIWVGGPAAIPLSIVAGALSYHLIERRFLRLRRSGPAVQTPSSNSHSERTSGAPITVVT